MRDTTMENTLRRLALEAGRAIMAVYESPAFEVRAKSDDSPVTEADLAADRIICDGLAEAYPDIAVVTEERTASHTVPGHAPHFLVDPLDGTREFVQRRREFTVNIALIDRGAPVAGVVHAPALGRMFRMAAGGGAVEETTPSDPATNGPLRPLRAVDPGSAPLVVLASRSHGDAETDAYIARYPVASVRSVGSSLKFCLLAAGEAHLYPRLGRTMEWDTAAGHAVLAAAGGSVIRFDDHAPLSYGKPRRENPFFIAHAPGVRLVGPPLAD
jgi:3'(2'), 5'-bisphosphate nucleotidase